MIQDLGAAAGDTSGAGQAVDSCIRAQIIPSSLLDARMEQHVPAPVSRGVPATLMKLALKEVSTTSSPGPGQEKGSGKNGTDLRPIFEGNGREKPGGTW